MWYKIPQQKAWGKKQYKTLYPVQVHHYWSYNFHDQGLFQLYKWPTLNYALPDMAYLSVASTRTRQENSKSHGLESWPDNVLDWTKTTYHQPKNSQFQTVYNVCYEITS